MSLTLPLVATELGPGWAPEVVCISFERKCLAPFYLGDPLKKANVDGKMQYAWKK